MLGATLPRTLDKRLGVPTTSDDKPTKIQPSTDTSPYPYFGPGFFGSAYNTALSGALDNGNTTNQKLLFGLGALEVAPMALAEGNLRGFLNVPYQTTKAAEQLAQAHLSKDPQDARLHYLQAGTGFLGAFGSALAPFGAASSKQASFQEEDVPPVVDPDWLARMGQGRLFNKQRASAYPHNEIYIHHPKGGYVILDSYSPISREIVSRKLTQLSQINSKTGVAYVNELPSKYPAGAAIASVPSSAAKGLSGAILRGRHVLEVPVQKSPVPKVILDAARKADVQIRDANGTIHR
jgi:filamentous hemagglutinin